MKDLLSRIEKLESKMLPPKPALILRIGQDEAKARQEYRANNGFPPDRFIQVVRATPVSTKDLIKRIEALENAGGRAPGYLVEMLRNEMVQAGIDYQLPPNMSTGDCLARLIELKPD